jgi:hypothetical protein
LRWLDLFFGRGVDDAPVWLLAVRLNVLLLVACTATALFVLALSALRGRCQRGDLFAAAILTLLAAWLRFALAPANLFDFGGISYSRLLYGYPGHFGTAQLYSLVYQWTARDIEHAILLNRIAGALTVPLVFTLCRLLRPDAVLPALLAALLIAVSPLHVLFSASDVLAIPSIVLAALSYTLLAAATRFTACRQTLFCAAAVNGLALLTQARYENALLLVPAAAIWFVGRRSLPLRAQVPALVAGGLLLSLYGYAALTTRITYQNPINLAIAADTVAAHLLHNPFLTLPVLFLATAVGALRRGVAGIALVLLTWLPALALPILAESAFGMVRVFCTWLVLILPLAGEGLAGLLAAANPLLRLLGAAALAYLVTQPLLLRGPLSTQYLEMREHVAFRAGLLRLPEAVQRVVVPDDELQRRHTHSTVELSHKYALIAANVGGLRAPVEVVGLTDFLADPRRFDCGDGRCAFFRGLPCFEQTVYPYSPPQCAQMLREHHLSAWATTVASGAPFLHCAVYAGEMRARLCDPTVLDERFVWYRVES